MEQIVYQNQGELFGEYLEHFKDDIQVKFEHWLLNTPIDKLEDEEQKKETEIVRKFVQWLKVEADKALNVKRGKDNLSYAEILEKRRLTSE